jgi:hypothetical protein
VRVYKSGLVIVVPATDALDHALAIARILTGNSTLAVCASLEITCMGAQGDRTLAFAAFKGIFAIFHSRKSITKDHALR